MLKVLFLTTSHSHNDDRIFYHQARELEKKGYHVKICSLCSDYQGIIDGVEIEAYSVLGESIEKKKEVFQNVCFSFQPEAIICSEPLAVIAAKKFVKEHKISCIYDVTEWYPAMSMLRIYRFPTHIIHALKYFLINLYAGFLSTHFIFGEYTKKFPLAWLFWFKKQIVLPYYPDPVYIKESSKKLNPEVITLCYTGAISKDKGIGNFFKAIDQVRYRNPSLKIHILIIGEAKLEIDKIYFSSLLKKYAFDDLEIRKMTSFEHFTEAFSDADICFDLRDFNFENHHSLPIKLFYFMGAGKPVIYSNLKGIRKHMGKLSFGYLVDPQNEKIIADIILNYVKNPDLYQTHALNAKKDFREKYNWRIISDSFLDFVKRATDK
ncbi:glycosyl transferase family 1 [Chryseobacterium phosphatilyticum]|uniref:Glycosyl transferase family 1 n=1 Tax=Chryseobacterium phosphatilyticum TaxID=475075 RepID=A0A316WZA2_9FLAO|nr:glycosyltransferase [Chryseobacterium phosphatilyticum]PWN66912.1 glycosyl transferase family 1 [Chryseobacterium phosphatilyticum]